MTEFLELDASAPVGRLTLNRPDRLNALGRDALEELIEAAAWFDRRTDVKVVRVGGAGRAFCAGFDLNEFLASAEPSEVRETADRGRVMADAITGMRALTVAAIQGRCVGGGLVLAAACDIRLADSDAVFSIPEVDLGIPLAWSGIPRLVREIGPALTKELVLTCRPFGAEEARAAGFLNRVTAPEELGEEAEAMARTLASKPQFALSATKRQVNAVTDAIAPPDSAMADADVLLSATRDPESRKASEEYLGQRTKRPGPA